MRKLLILAFTFLTAATIFGQKAEILKGNWENLEGISNYSVVFDYSGYKVNRYESEAEFIKDVAGRFDNKGYGVEGFKDTWIGVRKERYEPKFITSFNLRFKNNEVSIEKDNENANYIMKVHTTQIVTGFTNGTLNKASKLDAVISIYKKNDPDNILFEVKYTRVQGNNAIPITVVPGYTVAESYAKLAKTFAKTIKRNAW